MFHALFHAPPVFAMRRSSDGIWLSYSPPSDPGCPPQEQQLLEPKEIRRPRGEVVPFMRRRVRATARGIGPTREGEG
jgi:hypothetical protein